MPENKSIIDRITGTITSTTALIVAVGGLLAVLAGYGFFKPNPDSVVQPDLPVPTCFDGMKNGSEGGIDCGGDCAKKCGEVVGEESGVTKLPPLPTCIDGIKNGSETGVDCGGTCPSCNPPAGSYTNLKNVIIEGTRLTKNSGGKNWNAGATSTKHLPAGVAGGVSYTIKDSDGIFLFGLTPNAGDASYKQIKFALAVQPGTDNTAQINVWEAGINRRDSKRLVGTEIRIDRSAAGDITYLIDGQKLTGIPPSSYTGRLILDVSIKDNGVTDLTLFGGWRK